MEFIKHLQSSAFDDLDVTQHTLDLQGWVNTGFDKCLGIVTDKLKPISQPVVLEVGSWKGASACKIASALKSGNVDRPSLICVDTWLGAPEFWTWGLNDPTRGVSLKRKNGYPLVYETFIKNVKAQGLHDIIAPFPMSSVQAADVLKHYKISAHVMYIDAAHEYEAVKQDLATYHPLLQPGGIMWGDDYAPQNWPGVVRAVSEFAKEKGMQLVVHGQNWLLFPPT